MGSNNYYCPPTMCVVKINNPGFEYKTIWGCLICKTILLTKNSAKQHKRNFKQPNTTKEVEKLQ